MDAYAILARIYAANSRWGDLDALLAISERAVPDDLAPYYRAGEALVAAHRDFERARRYFERYLAIRAEGNEPMRSTTSAGEPCG